MDTIRDAPRLSESDQNVLLPVHVVLYCSYTRRARFNRTRMTLKLDHSAPT